MPRVRIGIDVGGTFTHAVAVDGETSEILADSVVPTTHSASEGVARGIVDSLKALISSSGLSPSDVTFIAHSTTQATNALLEGDVARVGIVGIGGARGQMDVGKVELGSGKAIGTIFDSGGDVSKVVSGGAEAVVAASPFSVDDPSGEIEIVEKAGSLGVPAFGTHEISGLYGLKARTRTSVINASILPKMLEAASMTESAVKGSGIRADLMVMRSDGGVMSLGEVRRRPILTLLSGPAAGVAAALMHEKISQGIFIEVGGTSTDITVIKDGRALLRSAEVGGHRLYMKTLDVRTVGVAGGSMPRVSNGRVTDVGPRSAHIAGLPYSCFSSADAGRLEALRPREGDPGDYAAVRGSDGKLRAVTVTCAANALGLVPEGSYARGFPGKVGIETARRIMDIACARFVPVISDLIGRYGLSKEDVVLVGGGGGAGAIVPCLAERMGFDFRIAKRSELISAVGAALAMLHDTVEKSVVDPGKDDILKVRREAESRIISMGGRPETVEVRVEVDSKRNLVRASAFGATELSSLHKGSAAGPGEKAESASKSMRIPSERVKLAGEAGGLSLFVGEKDESRLFGLVRERRTPVRAVDSNGVVRFQRGNASVSSSSAGSIRDDLAKVLGDKAEYGDAGISMPEVFLVQGGRIVDLTGLATASQVLSLAEIETKGLEADEPVFVISSGG